MAKLRKGDNVKVLSGKDKGKNGVIQRVYTETDKVLIEGINMVTKHIKPTKDAAGRIDKVNRPIHISNVVLIDSKTNNTTRIGYKIVDGKKYRFSKKSNELIDK